MKSKYIAIMIMVSCIGTPLLVNAASGTNSIGLFGSIFSAIQNEFSILYQALTKNVVPAATTQSPGTPQKSITLKLGSKSVLVVVLQKALVEEGYLTSAPTGIFDVNTQSAVEAFQKAKGLPVTGSIAIAESSLASSFSALASPFAPITVGATGTRATAFQKYLVTKGDLNIATTTAYFGSQTSAAVKIFQKQHDLPQSGIVDQATFAAMNQ